MVYLAYNLLIQSDIPLPLPTSNHPEQHPDIIISIAEIKEPEVLSRTYDGVLYAYQGNHLFVQWESVCSFMIQDGNRILVSPSESPNSSLLVPLLGTIIAIALHQRNLTVLHGSSILFDNKALLFLGEKGEGKSTLAGYLQKQGHLLLSDDICALDTVNKLSPSILPSFSKIKLWPDTMHFLEYHVDNHERVHPQYEKRIISLETGFSESPSPVAALIVLSTGSDIRLDPLSGHEAIPLFIPHMIINRFPENQPSQITIQIYFQITRLIKHCRLFKLTRPRDLNRLSSVHELLTDLARNFQYHE